MHSHPGRVTGRHSVLAESEGPEILTDELWDAEPGAGANRAEPLGFALGFLVCSHQFSGRSAWTFGVITYGSSAEVSVVR